MKYFVFRNSTLEPYFANFDAVLSGYDDILETPIAPDSYIWFYLLPFKSDSKSLIEEIHSYYNKLLLIIQQIPTNKQFFILTLDKVYINTILTGDFSLTETITWFNLNIIRLSETHKNLKIIDITDFTSRFSFKELVDWKFYYLSRMQLNPKLSKQFYQWFDYQINSIQMKRKKCLVLDLDNTLWGGILGEDGIYGIKIGGDYPGNAFLDFQKSILELNNYGIILAICSKNNESDVLELWEKNPYIIIRKENLAGYRINWNNKVQNIKELIEELNIGLDSVVFFDDNPAERELIQKFLPAVETPEFPSMPYLLPVFIKEMTEKYFRVYQTTEEDLSKTKQYQDNVRRNLYKESFSDLTEYLTSLQIELEVQAANSLTIPRISQLTQKTNQFNLTSKRYTETEILALLDKGYIMYTLSVKDRFGDHGITGLIIIELNVEESSAEIDTFLVSCRILGKGIEEAFAHIVFKKLRDNGIAILKASFFPTNKNMLVKDFYDKLEFSIVDDQVLVENRKNYVLDLIKSKLEIKAYFNVKEINHDRTN